MKRWMNKLLSLLLAASMLSGVVYVPVAADETTYLTITKDDKQYIVANNNANLNDEPQVITYSAVGEIITVSSFGIRLWKIPHSTAMCILMIF